jgi:butyrate kinase
LATSGRYEPKALLKRLVREGGLLAYLGTNDAVEIEKRMAAGDEKAREVYEALAYQVAKEVGAMTAVLCGEVDAILITGGMAFSEMLTGWITKRVQRFAPVHVYPGEDELLALAEGALRILRGEEVAKRYER